MAKFLFITLFLGVFSDVSIAAEKTQTFIGKIPGEYINKSKTQFYLGKVVVQGQLITEVSEISTSEIESILEEKSTDVFLLKENGQYLAIYPGLINLHNHPKQNVLPLWGEAKGQFANRHEWRDWSVYSHSLGGNMNPWVNNGKVETCAAFRWSELQAAAYGTTLMQGPRYCTDHFGVGHVETSDGFYNDSENAAGEYVSKELNPQAPTDLFLPDEMVFIWEKIKPRREKGETFHAALFNEVKKTCPKIVKEIEELAKEENEKNLLTYNERQESFDKRPTYNKFLSLDIAREKIKLPTLFTRNVSKKLSDKKYLEDHCEKERHNQFDLYFADYHRSIVSKILTLKSPRHSGIIAHLGEGRRNDPYNKIEFEIAHALDLLQEGLSIVHGVGFGEKELKVLKKNKVDLIWSPFSNLLLYGETIDIEKALELGLTIALGSDWTPTGSKSVLEELKIAKRYAEKMKLRKVITDEVLYKMVTENPARIIRKFEQDSTDGRHGVGALSADGVASFIAVQVNKPNPYSNLVNATEKNISLVVIMGNAIYGDLAILEQMELLKETIDLMPVNYSLESLKNAEIDYETISLIDFFSSKNVRDLEAIESNVFARPKGFVFEGPIDLDDELKVFFQKTGLNLNRPRDIQKVLHLLLVTQSRNAIGGKEEFAINYFPSLISHDDEKYLTRFENFIQPKGEDELDENYVYRLEWRREQQDARTTYNSNNPHLPPRHPVPYRLATDYGIDYDLETGVIGY